MCTRTVCACHLGSRMSLLSSLRVKSTITTTPTKTITHYLPPRITPSHEGIIAFLQMAAREERSPARDGSNYWHRLRVIKEGYVLVCRDTHSLRLSDLGAECHSVVSLGYVWNTHDRRKDIAQTEAYYRKHLLDHPPFAYLQHMSKAICGFTEPELHQLVSDTMLAMLSANRDE